MINYVRVETVQLILSTMLIFTIIAHPTVYKKVHQVSKKIGGPSIVTSSGVATKVGLLVHAITATVLLYVIFSILSLSY